MQICHRHEGARKIIKFISETQWTALLQWLTSPPPAIQLTSHDALNQVVVIAPLDISCGDAHMKVAPGSSKKIIRRNNTQSKTDLPVPSVVRALTKGICE